ncbi:hypothetical protein ABVK25_011234 [Lepraria finkii]|uniref:Uncharacterized protein n=1 Tax=Lepraria finkii TaxID=1340010 RepID=A0ABR4AWN8_9LECA
MPFAFGWASIRQVARPIPEAPPVTAKTLDASDAMNGVKSTKDSAKSIQCLQFIKNQRKHMLNQRRSKQKAYKVKGFNPWELCEARETPFGMREPVAKGLEDNIVIEKHSDAGSKYCY